MDIKPEGSINIAPVANGYVVEVNGCREAQEDRLRRRYVFSDINSLNIWLKDTFEPPQPPVKKKRVQRKKPVFSNLLDAEITSWLDELKAHHTHGDLGDGPTCETGDPYVTISAVGNKKEYSLNAIWEKFKVRFDNYRKGRHGKLYWRLIPEVKEFLPNCEYRVRCRCFIAEKESE